MQYLFSERSCPFKRLFYDVPCSCWLIKIFTSHERISSGQGTNMESIPYSVQSVYCLSLNKLHCGTSSIQLQFQRRVSLLFLCATWNNEVCFFLLELFVARPLYIVTTQISFHLLCFLDLEMFAFCKEISLRSWISLQGWINWKMRHGIGYPTARGWTDEYL